MTVQPSQLSTPAISKMRVAELKAELSARGLSTAGLKKDLTQRLEESLMAAPATPTPAPVQPRDNAAVLTTSDSSAETAETTSGTAKGAEVSSDEPKPVVTKRRLRNELVEAAEESTPKRKRGRPKASTTAADSNEVVTKEEDGSGDQVAESQLKSDATMSDVVVKSEPALAESAEQGSLAANADISKDDTTVTEVVQPVASRTERPRSPVKGAADTAPNAATSGYGEQKVDAQEAPTTVSEHPEGPQTPLPPDTATDTVLIRNLVRPFQLGSLKRMLATHGDIKSFWIDQIKSHCFVTFTSVEAAVSAHGAIHGAFWPERRIKSGRPLVVDFLSETRSQDLIAEEEQRMSLAQSSSARPSGGMAAAASTSRSEQNGDQASGTGNNESVSTQRSAKHNSMVPGAFKSLFSKATAAAIKSTAGIVPPSRQLSIVSGSGADSASSDAGRVTETPVESAVDVPVTTAQPPPVTVEDVELLYKKTIAQPCIYFRPWTDAEVAQRKAALPSSSSAANVADAIQGADGAVEGKQKEEAVVSAVPEEMADAIAAA